MYICAIFVSHAGERAGLQLELRETTFNVTEPDSGEDTYVLVELDVLRNMLQSPLYLQVFVFSNARGRNLHLLAIQYCSTEW